MQALGLDHIHITLLQAYSFERDSHVSLRAHASCDHLTKASSSFETSCYTDDRRCTIIWLSQFIIHLRTLGLQDSERKWPGYVLHACGYKFLTLYPLIYHALYILTEEVHTCVDASFHYKKGGSVAVGKFQSRHSCTRCTN